MAKKRFSDKKTHGALIDCKLLNETVLIKELAALQCADDIEPRASYLSKHCRRPESY